MSAELGAEAGVLTFTPFPLAGVSPVTTDTLG